MSVLSHGALFNHEFLELLHVVQHVAHDFKEAAEDVINMNEKSNK